MIISINSKANERNWEFAFAIALCLDNFDNFGASGARAVRFGGVLILEITEHIKENLYLWHRSKCSTCFRKLPEEL